MVHRRRSQSVVSRSAVLGALLLSVFAANPLLRCLGENPVQIHEGWQIQSACKVKAGGAELSSTGYQPKGWIQAAVPTTVVAAQVAAGILPDPYYGMNMRKLPGSDYPIGKFFSNLEMPKGSPYRCGWWYRREFEVPASTQGQTTWMHFGGINYRADIWIDGQLVANSKQIAGAYRIYNLDISKAVKPGRTAVVAVEVFAPGPLDLGINWVDWNPYPPDKDMGLWGPVSIKTTGPVAVRYPFITTDFEGANLGVADITATAQLVNSEDHAVSGTLSGVFAGEKFQQPVELAANETREVSFSSARFPQLKIKHPHVWWPAEMGAHPLETLSMRFTVHGKLSDTASARVGIRTMTSELTDKGARLFRVNGKPILILAGGWSQDILLREDHEHLPQQIRMVKDLHLNAIRQEAKLEDAEFYNLTDENGILVMAGWCCCDQWEHWDKWTPEDHQVANASLRSQMLRLRHHASLLVWLNGSDHHPTPEVERAYLNVEQETLWPNPTLSSASQAPSTVTGPSGVKMTGPYNYVSPSYWLRDKKYGGAWAFNTETSPGPAIPQLDSLRKFIPAGKLWPINEVWDYHAGGGDFGNLDVFNQAMSATYGFPKSLTGYVRTAQTMQYDGERAMFEAFRRNKFTSTGVDQWMLNNGWPSIIWHLYDYYLNTGGGYFGTKKACQPLHVLYSYDDHSIYAVSRLPRGTPSLKVQVEVYDLNLRRVFDQIKTINLAANSSDRVLDIPAGIFEPEDSTHFVRLVMKNPSGKILSRNFYWIPSKLTVFDWAKTNYTHTPASTYANMQALRSLPRAAIRGRLTVDGRELHVHLQNPSHALAFQVEVIGKNAQGHTINPLLWSDDFVELMPGESRDLTAMLPQGVSTSAVTVAASAWNTNTLELRAAGDPQHQEARSQDPR